MFVSGFSYALLVAVWTLGMTCPSLGLSSVLLWTAISLSACQCTLSSRWEPWGNVEELQRSSSASRDLGASSCLLEWGGGLDTLCLHCQHSQELGKLELVIKPLLLFLLL